MDHEPVNLAILAISIVAALLGVTMLASGELFALGALLISLLGFAYLKADSTGLNLGERSRDNISIDSQEDALTVLRQRYAQGDIDESEFERRLDDLLATETIEQAKEYHDETPVKEQSQ